MAIAEPLNNTTKSKFRVVYKEGDTGTVRSRSVSARSSGEAVADVRRSKKPVIGSTIKRSFIKSPRAFESPDKDNLAEAYKSRLDMAKDVQRKFSLLSKFKRKEVDTLKSIKQKEVVNKFAEDHPRQLHKLANKKFRKSLVESSDLKDTKVHKADASLTRSIKKVDPKFDPNKGKKIGAITGAVAGVGTMVGVSTINPALSATPGIGPTSMMTYGTAIGSGVDSLRIKRLGKKSPSVRRNQLKLKSTIKSVKKDNKRYISTAKRIARLRNKKNKRK